MRLQHLAAVLGAREARADDGAQLRTRLIEAINKRDTRTVESLVAFPLRAEKLRFASETPELAAGCVSTPRARR